MIFIDINVLIILFLIISVSSSEGIIIYKLKKRRYRNSTESEKKIMIEAATKLINSKCLIQTVKGSIVGTLVEVTPSAIVIKNTKELKEIINIDYLVSIKEKAVK